MTKIKFCGLRTLDDIYAANEIFPEYVGFVFAPKSKRYVTPETAEKLRELVPHEKIFVSESGVQTPDDVKKIRVLGADAVLIGETLMRADDKKSKLAELRGDSL